jgi:aspartate/tyrosine/aromatic aminotransferase
MADRIQGIRTILYDSLLSERVRGNWDKILLQKGMFSFTGLTVDHVNQLKQNHHIYMLGNGRISLSGLNQSNIGRFVQALVQVLGRYEQS